MEYPITEYEFLGILLQLLERKVGVYPTPWTIALTITSGPEEESHVEQHRLIVDSVECLY